MFGKTKVYLMFLYFLPLDLFLKGYLLRNFLLIPKNILLLTPLNGQINHSEQGVSGIRVRSASGRWAGCRPVHLERGYQGRFSDIAAPHPRHGPRVRVYLGVPVGRVPEDRVIGVFLKGGRS